MAGSGSRVAAGIKRRRGGDNPVVPLRSLLPALLVLLTGGSLLGQGQTQSCCRWAEEAIEQVRASSFRELEGKEIRVRTLRSESDYLQARFEIRRFLFGRRMRYVILVNPQLDRAALSEAAVKAILAHELAHVAHYAKGSRFRLFGLAGLLSTSKRARFERAADREAIRRGHGSGLQEYRRWLYLHVPASKLKGKLRDYMTPEEIAASTPHK